MTARMAELKMFKEEHEFRQEDIATVLNSYEGSLSRAMSVREKMPWVTEEEQANFIEQLKEVKDWIDAKVAEQEGRPLTEPPIFTSDELNDKMELLNKAAKKVYGKRRPKDYVDPAAKDAADEASTSGSEDSAKSAEPINDEL